MEQINLKTKLQNGFDTLEQRVIASFYLTLPEFYPNQKECDTDSQRAYYDFIKKLYETIYNDPLLLFSKTNKDYAFPSSFTFVGGEAEYADLMRKANTTIHDMMTTLMLVGKNSKLEIINGIESLTGIEEKINNRLKKILLLLNVEYDKNILTNKGNPFFKAYKWFSSLDDMYIRRFETCSFDPLYDYLTPVLAPLCDEEEGACESIIEELKNNGYHPVYHLDYYPKNNDYSVHYIKNIHNKVDKVGFPYMGDHNHIGFSLEYRFSGKTPYFATIRIQNMKRILEDFSKHNEIIQDFIIKKNHKCENCRYCVQTDKTGTKPLAHIKVHHKDKNYLLCTYYPGYNYTFTNISLKTSQEIIEFIKLIEKYSMEK